MWLADLHAHEAADTRIVDELGIAGTVRVDTAVFNGSFSGYEIKSAADTLRRLPKQVELYSAVLDYAYLVVASNHVKQAREFLPTWWGIIEAVPAGDKVDLRHRRKARWNTQVDAFTLCTLLWRDEVLEELEARGWAAGVRSKSKVILWERLAAQLDLDELRTVVRERVKVRESWREDAPSLRSA
ncbi:sce7726 family protein [Microbacterium sp. ZW T5_56]|uniref:sce7726 family protein n=1 Tax=Microbacterium sp. ZW T5_56 TaxID=3378081 RepID=UPI0038547B12